MDRDYGAEIDELREQLQALAQRIGGVPAATEAQAKGRVVKMPDMHPDPAIMAVLDQLEDSCNAHQDSGRLTYMGVFSLGGRQSTWIRNDVSANHLPLLVRITRRSARARLHCSRDRLNLLLAILKKPRTVVHQGGNAGTIRQVRIPTACGHHRGRPGNRSQWRGKRLLCHPAPHRAGHHPAPGWHWGYGKPGILARPRENPPEEPRPQ